ncbi:hypothetical protein TIFTF001_010724 [Ficus carica]|uniref:Uncharacterized protein n=1 Tax=Ficus carica TaxID=3494 RepID=A0AA87ZYN5_FICCA|nr:hypothetical protein TIFTF001_010724 [Ficus carica]
MMALLHGLRADHHQGPWYWSGQYFPDHNWTTLACAVGLVLSLPCCPILADKQYRGTTQHTHHPAPPDT